MPKEPEYPEHEKLQLVKERSQAIGEFLEWLREEQGLVLAEWMKPTDRARDDELVPSGRSKERLLADFFEIDLEKLEKEKRAMLDVLRAAHSR